MILMKIFIFIFVVNTKIINDYIEIVMSYALTKFTKNSMV